MTRKTQQLRVESLLKFFLPVCTARTLSAKCSTVSPWHTCIIFILAIILIFSILLWAITLTKYRQTFATKLMKLDVLSLFYKKKTKQLTSCRDPLHVCSDFGINMLHTFKCLLTKFLAIFQSCSQLCMLLNTEYANKFP